MASDWCWKSKNSFELNLSEWGSEQVKRTVVVVKLSDGLTEVDDEDEESEDDDEEETEEDEEVLVRVEVEDVLGLELEWLVTVVGGKGSLVGMRPTGHESGQWSEMKRVQRGVGLTLGGGGGPTGGGARRTEQLTALHHPSVNIHVGIGRMSVTMQTKESGMRAKKRP